MQKRWFGGTGLQVSIVGFGGEWISQIGVNEAKKVFRRAFELGIIYFDTARLDGDGEEKIGAALKDVRDECVLATKTASRTKKDSVAGIQYSLNRHSCTIALKRSVCFGKKVLMMAKGTRAKSIEIMFNL